MMGVLFPDCQTNQKEIQIQLNIQKQNNGGGSTGEIRQFKTHDEQKLINSDIRGGKIME